MRIVLTGGVTGGHIYPAIAIGDRFKSSDPECEIIYIASGAPLEREIISKAGYELFEVQSEPFYRNNIFKMAGTLARTMKGRSEAIKIMKEFKPDAVISTGSFVSVPVVMAGAALKTKIYLHEQNGFPGVSNKFLARYADKVFLGFENAWSYFKDQQKIVYSGNPVRSDFYDRDKYADRADLDIPRDDFVIIVFGGSLGSETTNVVGEMLAREYAEKEGVTIVWGTGKNYYDDISEKLKKEGFDASNVRIMPYISDMPKMLSACDISISRSGALSVAETTMAGRLAVFIPSPNVTEDHQYHNAKAVADAGGAYIVREDKDAGEVATEVREIVCNLLEDEKTVREMEEASKKLAPINATDIIYNTIMEDFPKDSEDEELESDEKEESDLENDVDSTIDAETDNTASPDVPEDTILVKKSDIVSEKEDSASENSDDEEQTENLKEEIAEEHNQIKHSDEDLAIAEKIRLRKIETAAKSRRQKRRVATFSILIIASITAFILSFTSMFTVDLIEVEGNENFSDEEIISMGHASPGKNIIYHSDKEQITDNLELNPYIKKAKVSRKLPSTLVIKVNERKQMMALKYDDDYLLLDREGILLQKSRTKPKLTLIEGNIITKIKLGEQLGTKNEDIINKTVSFIQMMEDSDLYYVKVDMSNLYNIKAYVYDTLVVKGDYDTLMENMENGRLHKVLDKLFEDDIKRGTITFPDGETASFLPSF